jgi:hypothetical protein
MDGPAHGDPTEGRSVSVVTKRVMNPREFGQVLVACLGADKGISAELVDHGDGSYSVVTDELIIKFLKK